MAGLGGSKGGGRKKGGQNRIKRETIEKAQAGGALPIEIMLKQMRRYDVLAEKAKDETTKLQYEELANGRAKDASPFLHARLQATTLSVKPIDLSNLTDEQIAALIDIKRALGGDLVGGAPNGAASPPAKPQQG
jgi:hypothetical protein